MCQLSFIHVPNDLKLEKTLLSMQLLTNSRITHTDGWGFYSNGKIMRSKLDASLTSNIGELINLYVRGTDPIIGHVRAASTGTTIKKENSHPFETKDLILAHNGTLAFRKKEEEEKWEALCKKDEKYKDMIDSEIFITVLQQDYEKKKEKTFPLVIKETMEKFYGKFAFLVYVKPEKEYYIIRGKTATLFGCQILLNNSPIGIIINTERIDLEKTINAIKQTSDSIKKNDLNFSAVEIVGEEKTFIYVPEKFELVELEEISQNAYSITTTKTTSRENNDSWKRNNRNTKYHGMYPYQQGDEYDYYDTLPNDNFSEEIKKIGDFINTTGLHIRELEKICHFVFGSSLLELSEAQYELLANEVITGLELFYSPYKGNLWKQYIHEGITYYFYKRKDIQFPYFLNDVDTLSTVFAELVEEKALEEEKFM